MHLNPSNCNCPSGNTTWSK